MKDIETKEQYVDYLLNALKREGYGEVYLKYKKRYFLGLNDAKLNRLCRQIGQGRRPSEVFGRELVL
jgi:hypothetical protein